MDPDPDLLITHPIKRLRKLYPNSPASNSGGVTVLSKHPLTIHYNHDSGNLIHFSIGDDKENYIPVILCYASPGRRRDYWSLCAERFNEIPDSIIAGDFNSNIKDDHFFINSFVKPLCLLPDEDPETSTPSFYPRGLGCIKRLDWVFLPCIIASSFDTSTNILPQTSPPISDHCLVTVTLLKHKITKGNSKKQFSISQNLFEKEDVREALKL